MDACGKMTKPQVLIYMYFHTAAQFLHDNGVLLHYNDQLKGLSNLYFIDPIWLANMLAEIITVPQRQTFVQNGILKESDIPFIFRDTIKFPVKFHKQYLQLMERYEIALSLGNGQYLIPSMLPLERPNLSLPFAIPKRITYEEVSVEEMGSTTTEEEWQYPVATEPVECIRRRYKMAYIPSGFWSRLISRLLINLKRSGIAEGCNIEKMSYWRRGLVVSYDTGGFLVESLIPPSAGMCSCNQTPPTIPAIKLYPPSLQSCTPCEPQHADNHMIIT